MSEFLPQNHSRLSTVYRNRRNRRSSKRTQSSLLRRLRYFYQRLLRLRSKPEAIARGLSVGVFAGFLPLFGLQIFIGVILATLVRGNKFAAAAGTWISNPLTSLPIYLFNFQIGKLLLGHDELSTEQLIEQIDWRSFSTLTELGFVFVLVLSFGSFVVGVIAAIITYFPGLWFIKRWRNRRQRRKLGETNN